MEEEAEGAAVSGLPHVRSRHIKKRSLKNKALSIAFNDKDLRDYVTGFHKRKKKRRREAQQNLQKKERLKRIEGRKKRKQEREYVQSGGALPTNGAGADESDGDVEQDEVAEQTTPVYGLEMYNTGDMKIVVTTSEITHDEGDDSKGKTDINPRSSGETENKHKIPVTKKPLKKVTKNRSLPRPQKKRDRKKGKKKKKKMH